MDIENLFSVRGKTALVTGGTSGIGRMIVEGLLQAGARVHTCARTAAHLDETVATLGSLGELHGTCADIGTEAGVQTLASSLARQERALHILVNNVGTTHKAPIAEYTRGEFERVLNINVTTVFDVTRSMLPLLRSAASAHDPARVINISSIGAFKLMPLNNFAYSASKAAVHTLTRHLGAELVKDHITVNAVAPGMFYSKLSAYLFDPQHPLYKNRPVIPIDRTGQAEDITGAVLYLASRAGSFVSGAMIPVAGGQGTINWN